MLPSKILLFVQRLVPFVSTNRIYRNDDFVTVCQFALANGIPGFYICFESVRQQEGRNYLSKMCVGLFVQHRSWFDLSNPLSIGCASWWHGMSPGHFQICFSCFSQTIDCISFAFAFSISQSQLTACNVEILNWYVRVRHWQEKWS